jgi:hypothetical protein
MDLFDGPLELGHPYKGEIPNSEKCLKELQKIRDFQAKHLSGSNEVFDPGLNVGASHSKSVDDNLRAFGVTCIWHCVQLQLGFNLKLLHTIDGYLAAVRSENPISTLLLARYCLELVATVNFIDRELEECMTIPAKDWKTRAVSFLGVLWRARHSSSDPAISQRLVRWGLPELALRPIRIGKAMQQLTSRYGFGGAVSYYDYLSNICHHNGSGHLIFADSIRQTDAIATRSGRAVFTKVKMSAITFSHPASRAKLESLARTARLVWWSAKSASEIIENLRECPFTDEEVATLTRGRLISIRPDITQFPGEHFRREKLTPVRRNDPCPCRSSKKYKHCCMNKFESLARGV